eukprot:8078_1
MARWVRKKQDDNNNKHKGVCKSFSSKNGYGFITCDDGSGEVWVYQTEINAAGFRSLQEGEPLEFDIQRRAINVTRPNGKCVKGSSDNKTHDPMNLYCACCRKSCRLKWPVLEEKEKSINWEEFDYEKELNKYVEYDKENNDNAVNTEEKEIETNNKKDFKFGRMAGKDMCKDDKQNKCTHTIGYGQIYCQHCGDNITKKFNPIIWKCPNCTQTIHGAVGTWSCIKIH